ncbi:MAG: penicillin-binding protein 2 [bacterium]|nr:penicillin-binding protein 2 [bacterium]
MKKAGGGRIFILSACIACIGGVIVLRLFFIQIKDHEFYRILAQNQHQFDEELYPRRGEIFFQDRSDRSRNGITALQPAAVNKRGYFAYAIPRDVPKENIQETGKQIASILKLDSKVVDERLGKRADPYEPLKRRLSDAEAEALQSLHIPGIRLGKEMWREYPTGDRASAFIGFVDLGSDEAKGLYGIERLFEKTLAGTKGYRAAEKDAFGSIIPFRIHKEEPSEDGSDIVLTIDSNIQFVSRNILHETLQKWESLGGSMIVLEPVTGKILALVSEPSYDPNAYNEVKDMSVFLNPAVEKVFEPGSVFKPITMAAALNEKLVTPKTTYTDSGAVRIGGYTIRNFDDKAYGVRTMSEVIELSLNTGAVYAQKLLGNKPFTEYVAAFGFGQTLGVDLPGELKGNISNLKQKAEVNFATAAFGQGISVTALQMASAIAAIANGGVLMRPYIVEKITHPDGSTEEIEPKNIRRVLTPEAARDMTRIMVDAVRGKFERRADVPGYFVAGKTGTAQIPDPKTGGYLPVSEGVIHTFVGFAPAFAPKFLVFIKMDKPVGVRFAANSLTPAFHDMAVYLLNYFNAPPDEPLH